MNQNVFTKTLGWVYECSPWIAEHVWNHKPFLSLDHLKQSMATIVEKADSIERLQLIKAHPDLASRIDMAEASVKEQSAIGLNALTREEYEEFLSLNNRYKDKFGFPFIVAVRGLDKTMIKVAMKNRISSDKESEMTEAIRQINDIASHRLNDFIKS